MNAFSPAPAGVVAATTRNSIGSTDKARLNLSHVGSVTGEYLQLCKKRFETSKNRSEVKAEVRRLLKQIAGPRDDYDSIKQLRGKAADALGFIQSRVDALWYGNARRVDAEELEYLRSVARQTIAKRDEKRRLADAHFSRIEKLCRRVNIQQANELPIFRTLRRAGAPETPSGPSGGIFSDRSRPID